jgi:predicted PurR-regulated permease PerM
MVPTERGIVRELNDPMALVSAAATAIIAAVVVGALYFGAEVLVPLALSVLLSFVLAPAVHVLHKRRVPRVLAVSGVVVFAFAVIFALGSVIVSQVTQLAEELPRYQYTMQSKIRALREAAGSSSTLERASDVLQSLSRELAAPQPTTNPATDEKSEPQPIPVEVREDVGPLTEVAAIIAPLVHPLTTTGLIIIFVIFILLQREDLRNRLIRLAGSRDLQRTTAALDDAAKRLSRLLLTQLALNAAFGVVIGAGLFLIGAPNAILWGIIAAILRFVPYVGAILAAVFPIAIAAAVDPGWTMLLWTGALFLVVEAMTGQVIEPLLYGSTSGLSPVAIIVSAAFWTALWGPIGLVLSTPLTICLVVLGRHVERLEFLDIMLGNRPALSPPELFYQRMLAGDPVEAVEKAEEFLKERSLSTFYDEVAVKGLQLAQADVMRNALGPDRVERIRATLAEVMEELGDREEKDNEGVTEDTEAAAAVESIPEENGEDRRIEPDEIAPGWEGEAPVLCIGGRNALDEASAFMLAQLLGRRGVGARAEPSTQGIGPLRGTTGVAMVALCYLDGLSLSHMRFTVRRLRRRLPGVPILLGCWTVERNDLNGETLRETVRANLVATELGTAVNLIVDHATGRAEKSEASAPAPRALTRGAA